MTPEDMKENFGPVGTVGSMQNVENKTINDKLDQIIDGINEINTKIIGANPEITEVPQIVEEVPVVEEIKKETIEPETENFTAELDEVVKELNEKKLTEVEPVKEKINNNETTQDFSNEINSIMKELEKQSAPAVEENTFTPVNVGTLPTVEEQKEENGFVDINTLLSENIEQPVVEQTIPVQPTEQVPVAPVVQEAPVVTPTVEQPVTPVETVAPVVPVVQETPVVAPIVEQPVAPVVDQNKNYNVVKDEYIGMTIPGNEIKTDGSPQRVMTVLSNEKIQAKSTEKTLVMNNAT